MHLDQEYGLRSSHRLPLFTVPQKLRSPTQQIRYGISIAACLIFWGWVMAVYQMPMLGCVGTVLCLLYISWVGQAAIPVASTWVVAIFWVAARAYAEPQLLYWSRASTWALSLILLWLMAMVSLVAIAQGPIHFSWLPRRQRFLLLAALNLCSLMIGYQLYFFDWFF